MGKCPARNKPLIDVDHKLFMFKTPSWGHGAFRRTHFLLPSSQRSLASFEDEICGPYLQKLHLSPLSHPPTHRPTAQNPADPSGPGNNCTVHSASDRPVRRELPVRGSAAAGKSPPPAAGVPGGPWHSPLARSLGIRARTLEPSPVPGEQRQGLRERAAGGPLAA